MKKSVDYDSKNLMFICTGSQGEVGAVLDKLANNRYPQTSMKKGNVVIFSSKVIPGNEKSVEAIKNALLRMGVIIVDNETNVFLNPEIGVFEKEYAIHASGHPGQPDLLEMFEIVKPHTVIPVHGDYSRLLQVRNVVHRYNKENSEKIETIIPFNGAIIKLERKKTFLYKSVEVDIDVLDGRQKVNIKDRMLFTRKQMGKNGTVVLIVNGSHLLRIYTYGVVSGNLIRTKTTAASNSEYFSNISSIVSELSKKNSTFDTNSLISSRVSHYIRDTYGKLPFVIVDDIRFTSRMSSRKKEES